MLQEKINWPHNKTALIVCIDSNIGHYLNIHLQSKGWTVYGTTRKKEQVSKHIFFLDLNKYKDINIDLYFDAVYFCLGLDNMDYCEKNESHSKLIIVDAQIYLSKYFATFSNLIVILSTTAVFDGSVPFVAPTANKNPKTIYGKHKAIVEDVLISELPRVAIVRITKVIAPTCNRTLSWIKNLSDGLSIDVLHDLSVCPIHISLVTELLEKITLTRKTEIYHLSGDVNITYYDIANFLATELQITNKLINKISCAESNINPKIIHKYYSLDATNTNLEFNLKVISYQEILKTVLTEFRKNYNQTSKYL